MDKTKQLHNRLNAAVCCRAKTLRAQIAERASGLSWNPSGYANGLGAKNWDWRSKFWPVALWRGKEMRWRLPRIKSPILGDLAIHLKLACSSLPVHCVPAKNGRECASLERTDR